MKLNIIERLALLQILPKQGNYLTLKVINDLQNNVSFSSDELDKYQIKQFNDRITWDSDFEKEFDFGKTELNIIKENLKKLDEEKKLEIHQFALYEKFMEL